jgi:hypothetical protein
MLHNGPFASLAVASVHPDWSLLIDDYRTLRAVAAHDVAVLCTPLFAMILFPESEDRGNGSETNGD